MSKRLRWMLRRTALNDTGERVVLFRIGVGYWPCVEAPFIQIGFWKRLFDVWYGLPSYNRRVRCCDVRRVQGWWCWRDAGHDGPCAAWPHFWSHPIVWLEMKTWEAWGR